MNELLNSLTGSLQTTSYSYPASNGINTVSPKATFKNFFSNLVSSFSGGSISPNGMPNPYQGGFPQAGIGTAPAFNSEILNPHRKTKALSPGSFLNSATLNQQANSRNQAIGFPPLQGFAGQSGFANPGFTNPGFPTQGGFPQGTLPSQVSPLGGFPQTNARGGILPMLIMPIVGLFTLIGSIFKIKKMAQGFKPVEVNKNIAYDQYNNYLDEVYKNQGSFDPMPEFDLESVNPVDNVNFQNLQQY